MPAHRGLAGKAAARRGTSRRAGGRPAAGGTGSGCWPGRCRCLHCPPTTHRDRSRATQPNPGGGVVRGNQSPRSCTNLSADTALPRPVYTPIPPRYFSNKSETLRYTYSGSFQICLFQCANISNMYSDYYGEKDRFQFGWRKLMPRFDKWCHLTSGRQLLTQL